MSTIHHDDKLDDATLTPAQREWLERQGRAARARRCRRREPPAATGATAAEPAPAPLDQMTARLRSLPAADGPPDEPDDRQR